MTHEYLVTFAGSDGYLANMRFKSGYPLNRQDIEDLKQDCVAQSKEDIVEEEIVVTNIWKFENSPRILEES